MHSTFIVFLLCYLMAACGPFLGQKRSGEPIAPGALPAESAPREAETVNGNMALDGKSLYEKHCVSCHGSLDQSSASRSSFDSIQGALLNIQEMQALPALDDNQITALVAALSKTPPGRSKGKSGG